MQILNLFKHSPNIKTFSAGEVIFRMGDYGDEMYVVQQGQVAIYLGEQLLEVVEASGILGEMVLLSKPTRTASAVAETDCRLVVVKSEQFRFLMQQTPYFADFVLSIFGGRLIRMNQLLFRAQLSNPGKS